MSLPRRCKFINLCFIIVQEGQVFLTSNCVVFQFGYSDSISELQVTVTTELKILSVMC